MIITMLVFYYSEKLLTVKHVRIYVAIIMIYYNLDILVTIK